ncbi:MAG: hypothetical protein ACI9PU_000411, partial [Ascidiaceihabitans sp.]
SSISKRSSQSWRLPLNARKAGENLSNDPAKLEAVIEAAKKLLGML